MHEVILPMGDTQVRMIQLYLFYTWSRTRVMFSFHSAVLLYLEETGNCDMKSQVGLLAPFSPALPLVPAVGVTLLEQ